MEPNGLRLKSKKKARKGKKKVPVGRGPAEPRAASSEALLVANSPRLAAAVSARPRNPTLAPVGHSSNTQRSQRRGAAVSGAHNDC